MNKKYLYILVFIIFKQLIVSAQPSWEKIKTPTDFDLIKIFYLDSLHCWVAGDSGVIMFSSDQGSSWQMQNSGVSNFISDIFFLNENQGWAVTFELEDFNIRSKILNTTDGGHNWIVTNYRALNIILTTIFFQDSLNGWIGGDPFEISFTDDGGLNWNPASVDTGAFAYFPINKIKFSNYQYGFAVGGAIDVAGVVWRSGNGGAFWKAHGIAPDKFDDFLFVDSTNVLALSADQERLYPIGVLKYDLQQDIYDYTELEKYGKVTSLTRRTNNEYWGTLGCDTSFIVSFDNTNNWEFFPTNDSICIQAIAFSDSTHGIAVGDSGYIFRYIPDEAVSVDDITTIIPKKNILKQNYPNPFNPVTKISWQSSVGSWQSLKVFDILGNEVATLVDEYRDAGSHQVEFNMEINIKSPASGIYFYQLRIGNYFESKKMILLK